jgi:hypothetical protein
MSLKSKALIVQARGRWELTHDGDDAEMRDLIDLATAEIVAEKMETILDAIGI